ncbi:hypothetical protein H5410_040209 [Solanum commersonii]|uniref:Uncharacterized protein n=1 Tax=Solanum commersonii TaxID=4109 RepID=A0A9J5XQB1_SOLCO|nr:hypothetical protein H5410_040209 [Solanum commersonii]
MADTMPISISYYQTKLVVPTIITPRETKYLSEIDDQGSTRFHSHLLIFYKLIEGPNRKLMVNCEGIMFIEADANVVLDKLGDSIKPPCPYLDLLLHNIPGSDGIIGCPLLLVQVTRFSCGGFAIGFRVNHTMMDAYGFKMFLNALSELIQGANVPSILPVWQRDLLSATSSPSITCTHHEFDGKIE